MIQNEPSKGYISIHFANIQSCIGLPQAAQYTSDTIISQAKRTSNGEKGRQEEEGRGGKRTESVQSVLGSGANPSMGRFGATWKPSRSNVGS